MLCTFFVNVTLLGACDASELDGLSIDSVASGRGFTCVRGTGTRDNRGGVRCWGDNREGQLGDGTRQGRTTPVRVADLEFVENIAAGAAHACAIMHDRSVYCWGNNDRGQLGDGTRQGRTTPVRAVGLEAVYYIALGDQHTCACTRQGQVYCWGGNTFGQLGDGTTIDHATPTLVEGVIGCRSIAAGQEHGCSSI